ncbi:MAG: response regulator [Desulfovibrio sp.]|nr:response regulator [Desulfovibrio sp.]
MKFYFSLSFQHKIFFGYILVLITLCVFVGYIVNSQIETSILNQKEIFLQGYAKLLDSRLGPGGYDAILRRHHAEGASREEKIQIISKELTPVTDEVANTLKTLGIGYYSRDLDAILTYGPSEQYGGLVGHPIAKNHPGRRVMAENAPAVSFGSMVRGDIMNAMRPISREGRNIGYIWANELGSDIRGTIRTMTVRITLSLLLCALLSVCFFFVIMRRSVSSIGTLVKGVRQMREDFSHRIPPLEGEMRDMAVSINDMAEEVARSNEKIHNTIAMLQNVMSNVDAAVYVCNPKTYEILYANKYVTELLGKTSFSGPCYKEIMGVDAPCSFCSIRRLFDGAGNPLDVVLQGERHNNMVHRDFFVKNRLIRWHNDQIAQMTVATDITQRKALELAEATNLAQKSFLARMSHELRTPMNGVLGMTHLALLADPPPRQLGYLKKIQSSASLLLGIINDILDFSRIEAGKMEVENRVFNLHTALQNIRELILPRTESKNVDLVFRLDETVPQFVEGDELRLSQVLLNLLGNAAKFTSRGSVVLMVDAQSLPDAKIRLQCAVRDSGIGMTEKQLALLFQPFSQADVSTSRKFGGTGLGLTISKALVELMGGEISVTSEMGQGSEFSFFVVLGAVDEASYLSGSGEAREVSQQHYRGFNFLLVEDNIINQEIALELLTGLEASVDLAENGEEAVRAFLGKDYDLIFMDVRMPIMDGLEATRRIRASDKHDAAVVPIIAMTANAMREDQEESRQAGMNGHLAKPIDVRALNDAIYSLLNDKVKFRDSR